MTVRKAHNEKIGQRQNVAAKRMGVCHGQVEMA
jgi:hypothetical protein